MKLIFDYDFLIFEAASIAEERYITAKHIPSNRKFEFATKTELWGDWRKREGGWIAAENARNGNDYYKAEDFEVVMCQRPKPFRVSGKEGRYDEFGDLREEEAEPTFISPLKGAKMVLDRKIKDIYTKLGGTSYEGYTGKGEVFRHELATLIPYKGNRDDLLTPLVLHKLKDYVIAKHNCELVEGIEADDAVNIAVTNGYKAFKSGVGEKVVGVIVDKDYNSTEGYWHNPDKDSEPREVKGFGSLYINDKNEVKGDGRIWLYHQVMSGDASDNYAANSQSDKKWGEKSSYKLLKDCTTDKQAFEALVTGYKTLYPAPKTITNFRGDTFEIDWLYCLTENFNLAKMMRTYDEKPTVVKDVLDKLKIVY